jgi:hypothetical protein
MVCTRIDDRNNSYTNMYDWYTHMGMICINRYNLYMLFDHLYIHRYNSYTLTYDAYTDSYTLCKHKYYLYSDRSKFLEIYYLHMPYIFYQVYIY